MSEVTLSYNGEQVSVPIDDTLTFDQLLHQACQYFAVHSDTSSRYLFHSTDGQSFQSFGSGHVANYLGQLSDGLIHLNAMPTNVTNSPHASQQAKRLSQQLRELVYSSNKSKAANTTNSNKENQSHSTNVSVTPSKSSSAKPASVSASVSDSLPLPPSASITQYELWRIYCHYCMLNNKSPAPSMTTAAIVTVASPFDSLSSLHFAKLLDDAQLLTSLTRPQCDLIHLTESKKHKLNKFTFEAFLTALIKVAAATNTNKALSLRNCFESMLVVSVLPHCHRSNPLENSDCLSHPYVRAILDYFDPLHSQLFLCYSKNNDWINYDQYYQFISDFKLVKLVPIQDLNRAFVLSKRELGAGQWYEGASRTKLLMLEYKECLTRVIVQGHCKSKPVNETSIKGFYQYLHSMLPTISKKAQKLASNEKRNFQKLEQILDILFMDVYKLDNRKNYLAQQSSNAPSISRGLGITKYSHFDWQLLIENDSAMSDIALVLTTAIEQSKDSSAKIKTKPAVNSSVAAKGKPLSAKQPLTSSTLSTTPVKSAGASLPRTPKIFGLIERTPITKKAVNATLSLVASANSEGESESESAAKRAWIKAWKSKRASQMILPQPSQQFRQPERQQQQPVEAPAAQQAITNIAETESEDDDHDNRALTIEAEQEWLKFRSSMVCLEPYNGEQFVNELPPVIRAPVFVSPVKESLPQSMLASISAVTLGDTDDECDEPPTPVDNDERPLPTTVLPAKPPSARKSGSRASNSGRRSSSIQNQTPMSESKSRPLMFHTPTTASSVSNVLQTPVSTMAAPVFADSPAAVMSFDAQSQPQAVAVVDAEVPQTQPVPSYDAEHESETEDVTFNESDSDSDSESEAEADKENEQPTPSVTATIHKSISTKEEERQQLASPATTAVIRTIAVKSNKVSVAPLDNRLTFGVDAVDEDSDNDDDNEGVDDSREFNVGIECSYSTNFDQQRHSDSDSVVNEYSDNEDVEVAEYKDSALDVTSNEVSESHVAEVRVIRIGAEAESDSDEKEEKLTHLPANAAVKETKHRRRSTNPFDEDWEGLDEIKTDAAQSIVVDSDDESDKYYDGPGSSPSVSQAIGSHAEMVSEAPVMVAAMPALRVPTIETFAPPTMISNTNSCSIAETEMIGAPSLPSYIVPIDGDFDAAYMAKVAALQAELKERVQARRRQMRRASYFEELEEGRLKREIADKQATITRLAALKRKQEQDEIRKKLEAEIEEKRARARRERDEQQQREEDAARREREEKDRHEKQQQQQETLKASRMAALEKKRLAEEQRVAQDAERARAETEAQQSLLETEARIVAEQQRKLRKSRRTLSANVPSVLDMVTRGNEMVRHYDRWFARPKIKYFRISNYQDRLHWGDSVFKLEKSLDLTEITEVKAGVTHSALSKLPVAKHTCALSILAESKQIHLVCPDELTRDAWFKYLRTVIQQTHDQRYGTAIRD